MKETPQSTSVQKPAIDHHEGTVPSSPIASNQIGIALALLSLYIIWGSTYLGMRVAEESIPPLLMAGIRYLLAGILLYTALRMRHIPAPTRAQWIGSALVGILLLAGGNGTVAFAEQWVASGLTAVALGAVPLWTTFFVGLMGRWPTRLEWLGLGLGFIGVLLLNLEHGLWSNPIGAVSLLLAPICWALGSALSSRVTLPSGLMASAAQMLIAGGVLLIVGLLLGEKIHHLPTISSLGALAYLIIFGSLVAFSAYGYLLRHVRPALATSYAYVNPVVAIALGAGLAGEHVTPIGMLAMFIILTGVGLVSFGRFRKKGTS